MGKPVHNDLGKKARRAHIGAAKPIFNNVGPKRRLGYHRPSADMPGWWLVILELGRNEHRTPDRRRKQLGTADDEMQANGVDILTYDQAEELARQWVPPAKVEASAVYTVRKAVMAYRHFRGKHEDKPERNMARDFAILRYNVLLEESDGARRADLPAGFPEIAEIDLEQLTREQLREFRSASVDIGLPEGADEKTKRARRATITRMFKSLVSALNQAFLTKKVSKDTEWRRVAPLGSVGNRRKIDYSIPNVIAILKAAEPMDKAGAELFEGSFLTGGRYGELCAVTVGDFNADSGTLAIPERSDENRCKTGARDVILSPGCIAFFKRLAGTREASAPLFSPDGVTRWDATQQQHRIKATLTAALKAAGLRKADAKKLDDVLYVFRHAHISRALENGVSISDVARNCGTSEKMIREHYAQWSKEHNARVANMLPSLSRELEVA